ncbi:MAG: ribosome maturation factor RimP [Candidatus Binatia bacterium]|nr:MAG: ribosome maturation factor RimP [Candidatus Binatia bacterium]
MATIQRIWGLVEPVAAAEGLEVVDIELRRGARGSTLRIFLDRQGGPGTIDLDTLSTVSRYLSDILDVHDPIPGPYTLEVSSPGINRRLRRPDHFRRYLGRRIRVRTYRPISGRRNFVGLLRAVEDDGIVVTVEGHEEVFPFAEIAQANYEHDFVGEPFASRRR